MESQKSNVPTAQNGKATPKNETAVKMLPVVTGKPEVKEPTPDELKKVIEDLNKKLSAIPQDLKNRVEYFNKKNELIRRLAKMDTDKESLSNHLDKLSEISTANDFENEEYFLNIEGGSKYNKAIVYTVKNPIIIGELIRFVIDRLDVRRKFLQMEIEA